MAKITLTLSPGLSLHLLQSLFSSFHSVDGDDFPTLEFELGLELVLANSMWRK